MLEIFKTHELTETHAILSTNLEGSFAGPTP